MKTLKDLNVENKKVIIRVDFNVPIKEGKIVDDTRIVGALPTIKHCLEQNAKVILLSHLGRVKEEADLAKNDMEMAIKSITSQMASGGMFVASIRDYDSLLMDKPPYSPPYIHETEKGKRVSFQTWIWNDDRYKLTQYIIDDEETLEINKFECEYRATRREELTKLFTANGCKEVIWLFPEETGFYQPIIVARK